jgi:hypothetical protein
MAGGQLRKMTGTAQQLWYVLHFRDGRSAESEASAWSTANASWFMLKSGCRA